MVSNIVTYFQKLRYRKSLKKATKHAIHMKNTKGYKCLVLLFPDGYRAITKQAVKLLWKQGYFKKGTTLQQIESMSVFTTN